MDFILVFISMIRLATRLGSPSFKSQEKSNLLFSSTTISNGACVAIVVATGMSTEIGIIQAGDRRLKL